MHPFRVQVWRFFNTLPVTGNPLIGYACLWAVVWLIGWMREPGRAKDGSSSFFRQWFAKAKANANAPQDAAEPDPYDGLLLQHVEARITELLRLAYVVEIQEPTVIANPGVMVGLNSLLDRCNAITLPTGEVIHRHPDCVVIVTTNVGYEGCREMNQSVLSRMNLIIDFEQPDAATMTARVSKLTGCEDKGAIRQMVDCIGEITRCGWRRK